MRVTIRLKGDKEARAWLVQLSKLFPRAAAAALYEEGVAIGRLAQQKAPVREGDLESSMYVALPAGSGAETMVEVGFGSDYAIIQHERTDYQHAKGEAKFLERAGAERARTLLQRVAARILGLVRRGSDSTISPQVPVSPAE